MNDTITMTYPDGRAEAITLDEARRRGIEVTDSPLPPTGNRLARRKAAALARGGASMPAVKVSL